MKTVLKIFTILIVFALGFAASAWFFMGPVGESKNLEVFVVPEDQTGFDFAGTLANQKLIKNQKVFQILLNNFAIGKGIKSGGYRLSQSMNSWEIFKKITSKPDLFWVTISFCPRKEQIGEKLAGILGWDQTKLDEWNNVYASKTSEYFEGVYYPDTYLLPADESPSQIAQRFINNFNAKFAPYSAQAADKNIKWTTVLKIASLIAREAAGPKDMGIISGIIWNRLNSGMALQIDATMQYTLGKNAGGSWWGTIDLTEKQSDSPYNSYKNKGLPPTPICSPNIDAIAAAINPEETDCLFYLHDATGEIHCAKTYAGHLKNIQDYLK